MPDPETILIDIEDATRGFESYGYVVRAKPTEGGEEEFLKDLRSGLRKMTQRADTIRTAYKCRGNSKRLRQLLHTSLPEPCWGVERRE